MRQRFFPPSRILTERLLLRCYRPDDAADVRQAIIESLEHLRGFMLWAQVEPVSVEQKADLLRRFRVAFERGRSYQFGVFDRCGEKLLGGLGLHRRVGAGAGEIGYWIHADHVGRGYATEASAALVKTSFEHLGLHRLEIHCDPGNGPSAAIPRKLGFELQTTIKDRISGPDATPRDTMIWSLTLASYASTPSAASAIEIQDESGVRLV